MDATFEEYFKQRTLSDADLVIVLRNHDRTVQQEPAHDARKLVGSDQQQQGHEQLAKFPVHQVFLMKSDFFKAQTRHWPSKDVCSSKVKSNAAAAAESRPSRPAFELTIDSADQLPAAEAVVATLYGAQQYLGGLDQRQLLSAVLIADRVHVAAAVKHAVGLLIEAATSASGLTAAAQEALARLYPWPGCLLPLLPAAVAAAKCCDPDLSDLRVIQTLDTGNRVQRMLIAVFGDLDAVWRDQQLQEMLLQLPLPAMQLLLSSDQLCVVSEDTVLHTAAAYRYEQEAEVGRAAAAALAPLIRCPHLSGFALKWAALSIPMNESPAMLLAQYELQLKLLLSAHAVVHVNTEQEAAAAAAAAADAAQNAGAAAASDAKEHLKVAGSAKGTCAGPVAPLPLASASSSSANHSSISTAAAAAAAAAGGGADLCSTAVAAAAAAADIDGAELTPTSVVREIPDAPDSWQLPPRHITSYQTGITLPWRLPVHMLKQACHDSISKQKSLFIESPGSAPLGGLSWQLRLVCEIHPEDRNSVQLGLYVEPAVIVAGLFYKLQVSLVCHQGDNIRHNLLTPWVNIASGYGDDDFFGVGALAGGWDDAAWAAKGLPATGDLQLEMILHNVW